MTGITLTSPAMSTQSTKESHMSTRVILGTTNLTGAYGSGVAVARRPHEDLPRFANDDGVVEVEYRRSEDSTYEPLDETFARLIARCEERGFRVLTGEQLDAELEQGFIERNPAESG